MTREQAREAAAVMLAWADGVETEVSLRKLQTPIWAKTPKQEHPFDWSVYTYRLKPTATLRPWTADEVPLGAWLRPKKDLSYRSLITSTGTDTSRNELFNNNEHSTDGGKTWLPCGVEKECK